MQAVIERHNSGCSSGAPQCGKEGKVQRCSSDSISLNPTFPEGKCIVEILTLGTSDFNVLDYQSVTA